ncbi:MAG: hypothetical protein Q4D20_08480 [Clostridia bacterium]|nr:hypothetical protein [Clostridia bacterium]
MEKIKNFVFGKPFCMFFLIAGFVYGLVLPWCWGNNPFDEFGTLSILCEDRKFFFWIWVVLVGGAYFFNTNFAFRKFKDESRFLRVLSVLTFVACCAIALSLKHDVHSWNPKRIVHWIATGLYIACVALSVFVFLMRNRKKFKGFNALAILTVLLVATIPVWLLTIGKSAMMEMIPNAFFQIMLFVLNFVLPVKEIEPKETAKAK